MRRPRSGTWESEGRGTAELKTMKQETANARQGEVGGALWPAVVAAKIVFKQTTSRNLKAKALGCKPTGRPTTATVGGGVGG